MRTKHHFCCAFRDELKETLEQLTIPYELFSMHPVRDDSYLVFDIFEDENSLFAVLQMIKDDDTHVQRVMYEEADFLAAEWLTLRCTSASLDLSREETIFNFIEPTEGNGYRHREIADNPFYMNKPVRWGKKHFAASYDLGVEYLFCDAYARSKLESKNVPVRFDPVLHAKTGIGLENVYYLNINHCLPVEAISLCGEEKKVICPNCGRIRYEIRDNYHLHIKKELLKGYHGLCKTPNIFALGSYYLVPFNLVSRELYLFLREYCLLKNLTFEPITLV
jgi:hypothetical protein